MAGCKPRGEKQDTRNRIHLRGWRGPCWIESVTLHMAGHKTRFPYKCVGLQGSSLKFHFLRVSPKSARLYDSCIKQMCQKYEKWNTGWPIWSRNTVYWHQIKRSATVRTPYIKAQLLFQCQQKVVLDQMDHPVLLKDLLEFRNYLTQFKYIA